MVELNAYTCNFLTDDIAPFVHVRKSELNTAVKVFYACDADPSSDPDLQRYDNERHSQILRVGAANV